MVLSFLIGIVLRLVNVLFTFFPALGDITTGLANAIQVIFSQAMGWNWILPVQEAGQLIVIAISFEIGIVLIMFGKWLVEMIRGK